MSEKMAGQAYQVIGALADATGTFETPEVKAALDYFSKGKYDEEFLPWSAPVWRSLGLWPRPS